MVKIYFIIATLIFVVGGIKIGVDWNTQSLFNSVFGSMLWIGAYVVTVLSIFKLIVWK